MRVAIIVPCLNEQSTVAQVVRDCQLHLPEADVYIFDNGSTDQTSEVARAAGAQVISSPQPGKGCVLRHAFAVIEADYYIMTDGDATYSMQEGKRLLASALETNCAMVVGSRLEQAAPSAFRPLHRLGNRLFTSLVRLLFHYPVQDLMSGLRVFSHSFAHGTPFTSQGFEIETELTIRAICQNIPFLERPIYYTPRPQGSHSKLRTFRDGFKILMMVLRLWIDLRLLANRSAKTKAPAENPASPSTSAKAKEFRDSA